MHCEVNISCKVEPGSFQKIEKEFGSIQEGNETNNEVIQEFRRILQQYDTKIDRIEYNNPEFSFFLFPDSRPEDFYEYAFEYLERYGCKDVKVAN